MSTRVHLTAGLIGVVGIVAGLATPAHAQGGVRVGTLTCNASAGFGFVFGSSRALSCIFAPLGGRSERYSGVIDKFGVDIGYTAAAVIVWGVIAPTANLASGTLAGTYAGAAGGAAVGAGLGANKSGRLIGIRSHRPGQRQHEHNRHGSLPQGAHGVEPFSLPGAHH